MFFPYLCPKQTHVYIQINFEPDAITCKLSNRMGKTLLIVGLGGFLGSIARYSLSLAMYKFSPVNFPYGTFLVNVLGCLMIGLIFGISEKSTWLNAEWRIFLAVGFCGGFTTFSTFAYENISMLQNSNYTGFFLYTAGSVLLGLLAVLAGLQLTK